ncbi:MAG TPA: D-glycero-beta-D-manno-heptose 1-phosphate adenylyltransferase [Candidatus Methylomirabilis sp.]|nr:D-glycero-beta-D-manno-heptose 1-phosphate adenylyltransferase [Candidatus Methylomirabilis sp.]
MRRRRAGAARPVSSYAAKIRDRKAVVAAVRRWQRAGKTVVFTNGCFDLLHLGHVRYLDAARALGDLLVVGLNSDASVRSAKGPGRPIVPAAERAEVLAALGAVDLVVLFDEPDPAALVAALQPDVLVKGADWGDHIIGREVVEARGGVVTSVPLTPGASTSGLIARILERHRQQ